MLSDVFAVQVCAYAVMSNHFHLVVRVDRELAESWSDDEVLERCGKLLKNAAARADQLTEAQRAEKVALWRERLGDLSRP